MFPPALKITLANLDEMKALYTSAPGQYGLTNRPKPEPGDGEALIKVIRAGFCANDLRIREGDLTQMGFPFIPGHQYAGIIEDCGPGVRHTQPGDRVAIHSYVLCGQCESCRKGGTHDCSRYAALGFTLDGGLAEYNVAPEKCLFPLPNHLSMDEGVLLESLANALAAIRRVTLQPGNRVLIIGATPIGLAAIQVARLYSPKSLVLLGTGTHRLKKAQVLGATDVVDIQGTAVENEVRAALDGNADAVLLCGYGRYDFIIAMELVGPMGRILVEGHYDPLAEIPFKPRDLIPKSITLVPNRGWSTPDFQLALELASNGMVDLKSLVTHTYTLDDWQEAFDLFGNVSSDALQVSIAPHGVDTR